MMLRYLVSNWMRQTAQEKVYPTVAQAARDSVQQAMQAGGQPGEAASQEGASAEQTRCSVLLAFALGIEAGGMADLLRETVTTKCPSFVEHAGWLGDRRIALVETGVGARAASQATRDAITVHRPEWVLSAGFAGALRPELRRGHILMASQTVDTAGNRLDIGLGLDSETINANPRLHTGRLLTVDQLVRTKQEKAELADQYDAVACDMETMSVAQACQQEKVRFLSVRIISDALDEELPKEIERLVDQKSLAAKLGAATGAIFNRPSSVKDMWKLKEDAIRASDRLAKFLAGVVPQL